VRQSLRSSTVGTGNCSRSSPRWKSGANNTRPELTKALNACRRKGAALVIAKLDRLGRDAHFLLGLEQAGVDFVAADMPNANRMTVGITSVIAEEERRMIAARTRVALAAAKARGVVLGGWKGGPKVNGQLGAEANKKQATPQVTIRPRAFILPGSTQSVTLCPFFSQVWSSGRRLWVAM
jgi:DNA invertase Pin-like site-specific DNA recombinase